MSLVYKLELPKWNGCFHILTFFVVSWHNYIILCLFWCFRYQTQLQKNLMYLAAIADAQPQPQPQAPAMPAQVGKSASIVFYFINVVHFCHLCFHTYSSWPRILRCNKLDITCSILRLQQQWLSNRVFSLKRCKCSLIAHNKCTRCSSSYTNRPCKARWEWDLEGPMGCLQCIILRAPMEEASKTTQRLGQVAMARGTQLVATAVATERTSDVAEESSWIHVPVDSRWFSFLK